MGQASYKGSNRVNRGGSWNNNARNCRCANRNRNDPGDRNNNLGLRLSSTRVRRIPGVHGCRERAFRVQTSVPLSGYAEANSTGFTAASRAMRSRTRR
ncbi:MAG: SUMF1/EgtB/PvdO family nonheme iron enzyme [Proteobacteria bacterium]|nr:SUMF1/EgtB/PvdO family nonheme iron enzyme [Pseudomonadota bacterium]